MDMCAWSEKKEESAERRELLGLESDSLLITKGGLGRFGLVLRVIQ